MNALEHMPCVEHRDKDFLALWSSPFLHAAGAKGCEGRRKRVLELKEREAGCLQQEWV